MKNKRKVGGVILGLGILITICLCYGLIQSQRDQSDSDTALVEKTDVKLSTITSEQINADDRLLYAAVVYFGYSKIGEKIARWRELTNVDRIEIHVNGDGNHFVYERKDVQNQNLRPNNFRIQGDNVLFESFIVHSNGTVMKESESLSNILDYINADQKRLETVYMMREYMTVVQDKMD